jgi:PadR family transcriptional regulator PadR
MKPTSETSLGEFEQIVLLALVRLRQNAYGVTVRREIEHRTGRSLSISAVYTALDRMEQKGLVSSHVGEPTAERGGRRRRYFELLPAGERALASSYRRFKGMIAGLEKELERL